MAGGVRDRNVADSLDPGVRPGVEHSIVKDAVDCDRGSDAKGERKDCGEREARVADDLPERKAEILEHNLHQRLLLPGEREASPICRESISAAKSLVQLERHPLDAPR